MWQRVYLQRLRQDIELWVERGWVTPENAQNILASAGGEVTTRRIPQILSLLGVVLIGFAAMSFVAANWAELPKLAKLLLLLAAMWAAYGAAFVLDRRGHATYAQTAIVGGLALFGANIMLIAQIYHVDTGAPGWILLWSVVALATAWALPSRPALAIGILLAIIWSAWSPEGWLSGHAHWAFFLPWAAALALTLRLSWLPGFHLAILTAWVWTGLNAGILTTNLGASQTDLAAIFILVALMLWLNGIRVSGTSLRFGAVMEEYGLVVTLALFWILQAASVQSDIRGYSAGMAALVVALIGALLSSWQRGGELAGRDALGFRLIAVSAALYPLAAKAPAVAAWIYPALFLALSAWLVAYGSGRRDRFALNAGFVAFGVEVLYLYFETLGSLLGTAAFFALGGVVLIAGSYAMARIRRHVVAAVDKGDAA